MEIREQAIQRARGGQRHGDEADGQIRLRPELAGLFQNQLLPFGIFKP